MRSRYEKRATHAVVFATNRQRQQVELLVDLEDAERVAKEKWHLNGQGLAYSSHARAIPLTRFVMGNSGDGRWRFINRNRLDYRKGNLGLHTFRPKLNHMRNKYETRGSITAIFVNTRKGAVEFLIDTEDLELVSQHTWRLNIGGYAYTKARPSQAMARLVVAACVGEVVDHIDHDHTNNCKSNLRRTNQSVNSHNRRNLPRNVKYDPKTKRWGVRFCLNYRKISLGHYGTVEEANRVAIKARRTLRAGGSITGVKKHSESGIRGIYIDRKTGMWRVSPTINRKQVRIGTFATIEEAKNCLENYHASLCEMQ